MAMQPSTVPMDGSGLQEPEAAEPTKGTECPVCNEDYTDPKLLHCNHLVCRSCILDGLRKTDQKGGCPLCRRPILPPATTSTATFSSTQDDLHSLVDSLPTDLTMVGLVEGCKILSSRNVCMHCDNNTTAASAFCLQCPMKLCANCAKLHRNVPALRNHVIEELSELRPERLVEISRSTCKSHGDRTTEMYCPVHRELICTLCAKGEHWECGGVKVIEEVARERRAELRVEVKGLREMETALRTKVNEKKATLNAVSRKIKDVFDHFQNCVDRRREELTAQLKTSEEETLALPQLDADRATVKSNADVLDSWLETAPDDALLEMTNKLRPRLNDLKQRIAKANRTDSQVEVVFDSLVLTQLESAVAGFGQTQQETSLGPFPTTLTTSSGAAATPAVATTANGACSAAGATAKAGGGTSTSSAVAANPSPKGTSTSTIDRPLISSTSPPHAGPTGTRRSGAGVARILKVGDRVKRGPHWISGNEDGNGQGTVLAVPSKIRQYQGCDSEGFVDVKWDNGRERCYRMGRYDRYDLDLV